MPSSISVLYCPILIQKTSICTSKRLHTSYPQTPTLLTLRPHRSNTPILTPEGSIHAQEPSCCGPAKAIKHQAQAPSLSRNLWSVVVTIRAPPLAALVPWLASAHCSMGTKQPPILKLGIQITIFVK